MKEVLTTSVTIPFEYTYTIIIPHKNIPLLLQRCLDSVPLRNDVQIIVVDDGSSSNVVDFTNFPGTDRENVEIIFTKDGKGAGYARNCGLLQAKGKWLLFADADDFFLPDFLKTLDRYCSTDYDLITFRATSVESDTLTSVHSRQSEFLGFDVAENIDVEKLKYKNDVPWAKMISGALVRKYSLQFDEIPGGNDIMFSFYLDYYAQHVTVCSDAIYCATIRKDSLQYGVVLDNLLARVRVVCRCNSFLRRIGREDKLLSSYYRVMQCRKYFGKRGYYKALWIFVCNEHRNMVYATFRGILMNKVKNICEKLTSW